MLISFSLSLFILFLMQNLVSFGKLAYDLVMSMYKIDGDKYPVVVLLFVGFVLSLHSIPVVKITLLCGCFIY